MDNTLVNNSNYFLAKWKFFLFRAISYFSFFLIPVYAQKGLALAPWTLAFLMSFYILFTMSQWFLLGKEIDHRFKIYFRVNSSIDRVVYRLFLGMFFFILLFNVLSYLDSKWIYNSYWVVWIFLGLFYSWPTRGKIIQESVSSNFGEFKFLDSFEKTLVFLIVIMFVVSIPEFPPRANVEMLKLYFDPFEKLGNPIWNFLTVSYYPFKSYSSLFRLAWALHFYLVTLGTFLLILYAFLRFFVSRRLSLLGVFALVSSWSFSKILIFNTDYAMLTTYSLLWMWCLLWVVKSSTYRAGLFLGLVNYWGVLLNISFGWLVFVQIGLLYLYFLKDRTKWYRLQLIKYSLFGFLLTVGFMFLHVDQLYTSHTFGFEFIKKLLEEVARKGFSSLGIIGVFLFLWKTVSIKNNLFRDFYLERQSTQIVVISILIFLIYSIFFDHYLFVGYGALWFWSFFSLIPLELIFQVLARVRSRRNMIYLIYILICLLDSHFEGRVKSFVKIFSGEF